MIPTPELGHLSKADFRRVYEPAEDTFILLDALEAAFTSDKEQSKQAASLPSDRLTAENKSKRPVLCVEIGSGSGCVSAFLSRALGGPSRAAYICTDLNSYASECTVRTGRANETHLEAVHTSLLSSLLPRIRNSVDVLIFNPPYVPTPEEEEAAAQLHASRSSADGTGAGSLDTAAAWAGGSTGTRLVEGLIERGACSTGPFAPQDGEHGHDGIENLLAPGGSFFLVAIKQNDPPSLVRRLQARGLDAEIALQRRAGREHLFVIRATKPL